MVSYLRTTKDSPLVFTHLSQKANSNLNAMTSFIFFGTSQLLLYRQKYHNSKQDLIITPKMGL
jgi:hypothetical protein